MLSVAGEHLVAHNPKARLVMYGQELNAESYAICKGDMLILLKEKRQAVISHAVTKGLNPRAPMKPSGIEWLGDVPEHWEVAPVSSRYSVQLGKMLDSDKIAGLSSGVRCSVGRSRH